MRCRWSINSEASGWQSDARRVHQRTGDAACQRWRSICHCLDCQRRTGGVFGVQARCAAEAVQIEGDYAQYERASDTIAAVILYTCEMGKMGGSLPAPVAHPCGRAAKALDDAGLSYEHRTVRGGKFKLWTLPKRASDRAEIERLTGQRDVPILLLEDGSTITGSGSIVAWAREQTPA